METSARGCVYNVNYHIVWCTKYRRKVIYGDVEQYLRHILAAEAGTMDIIVAAEEVMPDHVHLFVTAHPKLSPSRIVNQLKGVTSRMLFLRFPYLKRRFWREHLWNPSYYIGTCGDVSKDVVQRYIEMQKER